MPKIGKDPAVNELGFGADEDVYVVGEVLGKGEGFQSIGGHIFLQKYDWEQFGVNGLTASFLPFKAVLNGLYPDVNSTAYIAQS